MPARDAIGLSTSQSWVETRSLERAVSHGWVCFSRTIEPAFLATRRGDHPLLPASSGWHLERERERERQTRKTNSTNDRVSARVWKPQTLPSPRMEALAACLPWPACRTADLEIVPHWMLHEGPVERGRHWGLVRECWAVSERETCNERNRVRSAQGRPKILQMTRPSDLVKAAVLDVTQQSGSHHNGFVGVWPLPSSTRDAHEKLGDLDIDIKQVALTDSTRFHSGHASRCSTQALPRVSIR